jgi:hypothetical protein
MSSLSPKALAFLGAHRTKPAGLSSLAKFPKGGLATGATAQTNATSNGNARKKVALAFQAGSTAQPPPPATS